jgi:hypothetical protein
VNGKQKGMEKGSREKRKGKREKGNKGIRE